VGQGITTAWPWFIADELDLPVEKVRITLADARPELVFTSSPGGLHDHVLPLRAVRTAAAWPASASPARGSALGVRPRP